MKTKSELHAQLYDEFAEWFFPKYIEWQEKRAIKTKEQMKEILNGKPNNKDKLEKLARSLYDEKIEFIKQSQYDYYNVIFDKYNDGLITKRVMKEYAKEIALGLEETEKLKDMYDVITESEKQRID